METSQAGHGAKREVGGSTEGDPHPREAVLLGMDALTVGKRAL